MDLRNAMFPIWFACRRYYSSYTRGSVTTTSTFDGLQLTGAATSMISVLARALLTIVFLLGFLFYLNWKLTLVALLVIPPAAVITRGFSKRLRTMSRAEQAAMGDLNHALEESIGCHRVVKVFGGQDYRETFRPERTKCALQRKNDLGSGDNVPLI
jgi:subfamily B ATP-binding cassette protein MsbA